MSKTNDGGPAFPQHGWSSNPEALRRMKETGGGMTLRDWFAGQAMTGWLASYSGLSVHPAADETHASLATYSYAIADAMLAAREGGAK